MATPEQNQGLYAQVIAKAWADEGYKQRLLSDPAAVLREEGIEIPEGVTIRAVENTNELFHVVVPQKPDEELSEEALDQVAGGGSRPYCCFCAY